MITIIRNSFSILSSREKNRLVLFALSDVVISILDIAGLAALLLVIKTFTEPYNNLVRLPNLSIYLLALGTLFIIKNIGAYLLNQGKYRFVYRVATRLSEQNLLQYLEGNYQDYVNQDSAVQIRRISQQPIEFAHYVLAGIQQLISETIMVTLTVVAILVYNPTLFALLCAALAPPLIVLSFYIKKRIRSVRSNVKTSSELTLQHLKEALAGYIESNVYGTKDFFIDRYNAKQQSLNYYLADLQSMHALPNRLMEIFAVIGLLVLIAFNQFATTDTIIPVVTIGAFVAAAYKIIPGLVKILNVNGQVKTYAFTAEDMLPPERKQGSPSAEHPNTIQSISMKQVSFSYNGKHILHNTDLDAKQGELVGLTGLSGKGKTTLINLLLGFLEPSHGDIFINNLPATTSDRQRYWKNTSYVKQQPFLVHDTIVKNITLHDKDFDADRLKQATNDAGLDTLLTQLPQGLNTVITENGKNISGGQRQRIALARALYKDAGLLLLDEPFNELDEASGQRLMQLLQRLAEKGKLILLITHDTKSLSFCNKIISLDAT
ncbi:MAG TPA: ABC transporter ATP-binding protein [Chitinophagaceae bacterium]